MFSKKSHKEARYPCKSSAGKTNVKVSRNLLLTIASIKTPIIKDNYTFKEGFRDENILHSLGVPIFDLTLSLRGFTYIEFNLALVQISYFRIFKSIFASEEVNTTELGK